LNAPLPLRVSGLVLALVALGACRPAEPEAAAPVEPAPVAADVADTMSASPSAQDVASAPLLPDAAQGTPTETHWQCGDQRIAARFDAGAQTLNLIHERGQLALPRIESASGARYADANGNEFWDKADAATLTLSGTPARDCVKVESGWAG